MTAGSESASIMRALLVGADPVCCDCRRVLEPGEPRVIEAAAPGSIMVLIRCADCEYRRLLA